MVQLVFSLGAISVFTWLLMIFLPRLNFTKAVVTSPVFPVALGLGFAAGLVYFILYRGNGFSADWTTIEGILRIIKSRDFMFLVLLTVLMLFQITARMVYVENHERVYVPLIFQSMFIALAAVIGPFSYLIFKKWKEAVRNERRIKRRLSNPNLYKINNMKE